MQVDRKELQRALEIVKPGLANKELIEQSTSFAFVKRKVITYNDEISVSHPVKGLRLTGAIKADKLYALINKIKKDALEINVEESEIVISAGRCRAGFTFQQEIKLPLDEELVEKGDWKPLPENFLKFMQFAVTSCGKDLSKAILTCVHVNENGYIEASDSRRITRCDLKDSMPVKTFLIPATSVIEVLKIEPNEIAEGKGWVHFHNAEGTTISCRLFEDKYPDTSYILRMTGTKVLLPKSIDNILERASVIAKRDHMLDELLLIKIWDNRIKISATSESGWFEESAKLENYEGDPIAFQITPYLLKRILPETRACDISKTKIRFEGEGWVYISLLSQL